MENPNAFLNFIIRSLIVIFGLCALLVVVMSGLIYLAFSDLGPKSDKDIISSIPSRFEVTQVLAKDSDVIDGSCTAIILEISETASEKILEKGVLFFNSQTKIRTDVDEWRPLKLLRTEPEWIDDDSFISAVECADINTEFKSLAKKLISSEVGFYTVSTKRRTIYAVFPQQRKFFITHFD